MQVNAEPITTPRLDLLPLRVGHAAEMATVLSDPALHTFIGGTPATPEALRIRYEHLVAGCPDPTVSWCNWVMSLRAEARLIGTVQATVTAPAGIAEIAWIVGTPWQARGFAKEAAGALTTWLHEQGVHTFTAHILPSHHASAAVARAVGLSPTDEQQDGETEWRLQLP